MIQEESSSTLVAAPAAESSLETPLLLLRSSRQRTPPPRQAFAFRRTRSTASSSSLRSATINTNERASPDMLVVLDEPAGDDDESAYVFSWTFWRSLFMAIVLGWFVGALSLGLVTLVWRAHRYLFDYDYSAETPRGPPWKWVAITIAGGLVSRLLLVLVLPRGEQGQGRRGRGGLAEPYAIQHNQNQSQSSQLPVSTVLATAVALSTWPLLGPELALITLAQSLSNWWTRWSSTASSNPNEEEEEDKEEDWISICVSCVWGSLAPLQLLGPLAVLELHTFTSKQPQQRQLTMRTLTLAIVASTASSSLVHWILNCVNDDGGGVGAGSTIALTSMILQKKLQERPFDAKWYDLMVAPLLGVACGGLTAMLILIVTAMHKVLLQKRCFLAVTATTLLAGLLQGLLVVLCPLLSLFGLDWMTLVLITTDDEESRTQGQLVVLLAAQLASVVLSFGLGRVPGGCILPLVILGGTVGRLIRQWLPVAVLCGMVACPVALVSVPITATLTVATIWADSPTQVAPILLASLASWAVTRGTGWIRRVEQWAYEYDTSTQQDNEQLGVREPLVVTNDGAGRGEEEEDGVEIEGDEEIQRLSDDEILRGIRSAIFGVGGN